MKEVPINRITWIDTLKGVAIILVVWGHCGKNSTVYNWLYYVHLPIFFLFWLCYRKR